MQRFLVLFAMILGVGLTSFFILSIDINAYTNHLNQSDIMTVCPIDAGICDYHSIQSAVDAANEGDVIKISAGHYTNTHTKPVPQGYLGATSVEQVVYITKSVTLRGGYTVTNGFTDPPDPINNPSILDAQGQGRVLFIAGEISPTLEGLHVAGGSGAGQGQVGNWGIDAGGGMYIVSATTIVRDSHIYSNVFNSGYGGGIYIDGGTVTLERNVISTNTAINGAGVFIFKAQATIMNNTIVSNTTDDNDGEGLYLVRGQMTIRNNYICFNAAPSYGNAGGIYAYEADADITHNIVCSNTASNGGGIYWESNSPPVNPYAGNISENRVMSNTVSGNGGGIYIKNSSPSINKNTIAWNTATGGPGDSGGTGGGLYTSGYMGNANLEGNTFVKNIAVRGGGMFFGGYATFVNTLIAENFASKIGSGVLSMHNSPQFVHTTFAGNTGGDGSAAHIHDTQWYPSPAGFTNTIFVSPTVGISVTEDAAVTLQGTLFGTGIWANGMDWGGVGVVIPGDIKVIGDPHFANVASSDYHICASSDAIDAGINVAIGTDFDGDTRPDGSGYDIGYDENVYPISVKGLQVANTWYDAGILTATLKWCVPNNVISYTLKYSANPITEGNWDIAVVASLSLSGGVNNVTTFVPYTESTNIYFALKYWDACGVPSPVSRNA